MTCGIYLINHKPSGRKYVGQARNVEERWERHRKGDTNRYLREIVATESRAPGKLSVSASTMGSRHRHRHRQHPGRPCLGNGTHACLHHVSPARSAAALWLSGRLLAYLVRQCRRAANPRHGHRERQ